MIQKRLRLFTGLVMATFVVLHLTNAALGIASVPAMEAMRRVLIIVWGSPPGILLLMGSFAVHIKLALLSLYQPLSLALAGHGVDQDMPGLQHSSSRRCSYRRHPDLHDRPGHRRELCNDTALSL